VKTPAVRSLRQAQQVREVFGPISDRLKLVEEFISRELESAQPMVSEVAGYVLSSGGKRIRPALVLLISKALGASGERDIRYGAVVEFIHSATLIHDDIIDESDLRRGQPTANNRWGNQTTVLVGDWLYTRSMGLCLEFGDVDVMRVLTSATLQMTEGEIMADDVRGRLEISEELYMEITRRKTAELFAAACALPALFKPATLHLTEELLDFGRDLGLCFQLIDDMLDFTSNRSRLGKPVLADLREGRVTLPIILLLPRLDPAQRDRIRSVVDTGEFNQISEGEVLEIVRTSGVLDEVQERATNFAERAVSHLQCLPPGPEREALANATSLLVDREV
jgi:octaprenyl-diphosphate synthase